MHVQVLRIEPCAGQFTVLSRGRLQRPHQQGAQMRQQDARTILPLSCAAFIMQVSVCLQPCLFG